jgi:hypothetical protein
MGLFGSDPPKAQILCLEGSKMDVEAQFNPNELSYTRSTQWGGGKKAEGGGCNPGVWASPWGSMQFTGGSADTMEVTLLFDESEKRDEGLMTFVPQFGMPSAVAGKLPGGLGALLINENSVLDRDGGNVSKLHKLTLPMKMKDDNGDEVLRPPICAFIWGDFQFQGVIEQLKVDFKLFDANGVPRRAECKITMKGRALSQAKSSADFLEGTDFKAKSGSKLKAGKAKGSKISKLIDGLS